MNWFFRYKYDGDDHETVGGPFLSQADAAAAASAEQEHGAQIINASFQAATNYQRTYRPLEIAVVTKHDGLYRVMNDGSEFKIEE